MKEKSPKNGKGYSIDTHEIVKREVESHMRPFIEVILLEHEKTRDEVKGLKNVIEQVGTSAVHTYVQYGLIAIILIGMALFVTGC